MRRNTTFRRPPVAYGGVNENTSPAYTPITQLAVGDNARLGKLFQLDKRGGSSFLTAYAACRITNMIQCVIDGVERVMAVGRDTGDSFARLISIVGVFATAQTTTAIVTGLSTTVNTCLVPAKNQLFILDGTTNRVWDGTNVKTIGDVAPSAAPAGVSATGGSLTLSGSYTAGYTHYHSVYGNESPMTTLGTTLMGTSAGKITWTVLSGSATKYDTIKLYRTGANQDLLFYDTSAAITATTLISSQSDAALQSNEYWDDSLDNVQPVVCKYASWIGSRMYYTGNDTFKNRVWISKVGVDGQSYPESIPPTQFVDCEASDSDEIVGIASVGTPTRGALAFVLKQRSCGLIREVQTNIFRYERLLDARGGVSHYTIIANAINGLTVWLGNDDVYATDGERCYGTCSDLKPSIKNINKLKAEFFSAVLNSEKDEVHFSVTEDTMVDWPNMILCADVRRMKDGSKTQPDWFKWRQVDSTYTGLQFCSLLRAKDDDGNFHLIGGTSDDSGNGNILEYDVGTSDASGASGATTTAIPFIVQFPADDGGSPEADKTFGDCAITLKSTVDSTTITCSMIRDLGDSPVQSRNLAVDTGGFMLDDDYIVVDPTDTDGDYLGGDDTVTVHYCPHFRAKWASLVIEQYDADTDLSLLFHSITAQGQR